MVLKITKKDKNKGGNYIWYKTDKKVLTPQDIKKADKFDLFLSKEIQKIEKELKKEKVVSEKGIKINSLKAWYIVGQHINTFIKNNQIESEDKDRFWDSLYGRSIFINKTIPINSVSKRRNDFKSAFLLAKYPFKTIKNVGAWSLWREILGYRVIVDDERILKFVMDRFIKLSRTRKDARYFLKTVADRLRKIDTLVLSDKEILSILNKFT